MVYVAQDSDFEKIDNCWVYKGQETEVEIPEYINGELVTSTAFMFDTSKGATSVTKVVLRHKNVTTMRGMFYKSNSSAPLLDLSNFDTSNVTDMSEMFYRCRKLTSLDVSSFNTSNVKDIGQMFADCTFLQSLDVSGFDTSNVTSMYRMFFRCIHVQNLDLSNFIIKDNVNTDSIVDVEGAKLNVYIARKEDLPKLTKGLDASKTPTFLIKKKYLDLEGLQIYNEKVTGLINGNKDEIEKLKANDGQGLAVEIVSRDKIDETQNNSIIFVKR